MGLEHRYRWKDWYNVKVFELRMSPWRNVTEGAANLSILVQGRLRREICWGRKHQLIVIDKSRDG
ncbi:hypothetical protein U1Q18_002864, partial [Sarracenia purpurea var. burkii]